jgi:DNA-binding transcriptional MerR regulator
MLIGELSKRSGLSRDTIRYYEKRLLLVASERGAGNDYKNYRQEALERLKHIQRLKEVGFTLQEIGRLLSGDGNPHACEDLPVQLPQKIARIDRQVAVLLEYKASLLDVQRACNGACAVQDGMPTCVPLVSTARAGVSVSCC